MDKKFESLRPFDLEAARAGEQICWAGNDSCVGRQPSTTDTISENPPLRLPAFLFGENDGNTCFWKV